MVVHIINPTDTAVTFCSRWVSLVKAIPSNEITETTKVCKTCRKRSA